MPIWYRFQEIGSFNNLLIKLINLITMADQPQIAWASVVGHTRVTGQSKSFCVKAWLREKVRQADRQQDRHTYDLWGFASLFTVRWCKQIQVYTAGMALHNSTRGHCGIILSVHAGLLALFILTFLKPNTFMYLLILF